MVSVTTVIVNYNEQVTTRGDGVRQKVWLVSCIYGLLMFPCNTYCRLVTMNTTMSRSLLEVME